MHRDRADATVIGVLIIVGIAVALAAGLYVWVGKGEETNEDVKLVSLGAPKAGGQGVTVFTLPPPGNEATWNDLTLALEGAPARYHIEVDGDAFVAGARDEPWVGADLLDEPRLVLGQEKVTVTLGEPAPDARLVVLDVGGNRVVTSAPLVG